MNQDLGLVVIVLSGIGLMILAFISAYLISSSPLGGSGGSGGGNGKGSDKPGNPDPKAQAPVSPKYNASHDSYLTDAAPAPLWTNSIPHFVDVPQIGQRVMLAGPDTLGRMHGLSLQGVDLTPMLEAQGIDFSRLLASAPQVFVLDENQEFYPAGYFTGETSESAYIPTGLLSDGETYFLDMYSGGYGDGEDLGVNSLDSAADGYEQEIDGDWAYLDQPLLEDQQYTDGEESETTWE